MAARHFFWLYRPTLPSVRAQSIQILHSAHAMARLGHHVELVAEASHRSGSTPEDVLTFYGLEATPTLTIRLLSGGRTRRSVLYRAHAAAFVLRHGRSGVLICRSKRQAVEARRRFGRRATIVLETHELDSALARERGESDDQWNALEREASRCANAIVANCPGTLTLWRERHSLPPSIALQNATRLDRVRRPNPEATGVGCVGSARNYKDLETILAYAQISQRRLTWVGSDVPNEAIDCGIDVLGEASHRDIPDLVNGFRVVLLPLSRGIFGEYLSSPLKLWDYMAAGVPIVGADVASLRLAAPGAYLPYTPGDANSLHEAVERAYTDDTIRRELLDAAFVRTWDQRASEYLHFLEEVL